MAFNFNPIIDEKCKVKYENITLDQKMYFGREQFDITRIGCCGMSRNDSIYPIGYTIDFNKFKKDSIKIMNDYISGKEDTWFIEYYMSKEVSDFRGTESPIYEFYFNKEDKSWSYYENSKKIFTVNNISELIEKYENI